MALYTDTKAKILTPEGATIEFLTNLGILQGDVLAPFIFIVVLDFILRLAITEDTPSFRLSADLSLSDLEFADDIAAITNTIKDNTVLCQNIADAAAKYGLLFNIKKTQYMTFGIPGPRIRADAVIVNDKPLDEVREFKYLGSYMSSTDQDIKVRKGLAWAAMNSLDVFWKSDMSRKLKVKIFRTAVESILLYGCETWTLKVAQNNTLDGTYTKLLRRALNISWKSHTSNDVLYQDIPKISNTIRSRRLKFAGHLYRHDTQPAHHLLFWKPDYGARYHGRPKLTYDDILKCDTGLPTADMKRTMMDRTKWRSVADHSLKPD